MKVLRATVVLALLAGGAAYAQAAYAQDDHIQRYGEPDKEKSQTEIRADKAAERAYKNSLGNIPDAAPTDPWGSARGAGAPKPVAKDAAKPAAKTTAAKQPKAGTTSN
ncbi:hypothetical protein [Bradyrhizobium sp. S69]|jgi:hypothetical protein|uniref:hypothetical protein n=1 Tax=Bradyrhizobium sp. S69 TaxID=1641856 RepID=UPI00131DCAC2|nr:hypothetical protein [Bradyrhizobium sp. S69]